MDRFPHKLIGGGTVLLALTAALGWGGVNMIISGQLRQVRKPFYSKFIFKNNHKELLCMEIHLKS